MGKKTVIIFTSDHTVSSILSPILQKAHYHPVFIQDQTDIRIAFEKQRDKVLLIDLDRAPINIFFVKELRREYPQLNLIGLSTRTFHQELAEVMSRYIDACFEKTQNYEDLLYWLKAVFDPSKARKTTNKEASKQA